jgi:hypothetical protein
MSFKKKCDDCGREKWRGGEPREVCKCAKCGAWVCIVCFQKNHSGKNCAKTFKPVPVKEKCAD